MQTSTNSQISLQLLSTFISLGWNIADLDLVTDSVLLTNKRVPGAKIDISRSSVGRGYQVMLFDYLPVSQQIVSEPLAGGDNLERFAAVVLPNLASFAKSPEGRRLGGRQ